MPTLLLRHIPDFYFAAFVYGISGEKGSKYPIVCVANCWNDKTSKDKSPENQFKHRHS